MSQGYNRNARETQRAAAGVDITRSVMGRNAIVTDGRTNLYQHTAEDLINEARQLQTLTAPAAAADSTPRAALRSAEEVAFFRQQQREKMETLVQRNFRQLNNWLTYAEWEEGQGDYVRARSVYERAIANHGARPQLWRQYAEMEMRRPPPPLNKKVAAREAEEKSGVAGGSAVAAADATAAGASADVLRMLGVTSSSTPSGQSQATPPTAAAAATSSALMIIPSTAGSGAAAGGGQLAVVPAGGAFNPFGAASASAPIAPSERLSRLDEAVQRGGDGAVLARVRTVFDRALASLPQCDDLWMKYISFEATAAAGPDCGDEAVRRLFRRWLQYVNVPHVYELFIEFEAEMSHTAAQSASGGVPAGANTSAGTAARDERVEALIREYVAAHSSLSSWLFCADVLERRLGQRRKAADALRAAAVALGPYGKFAHNGALFHVLGRVLGDAGLWATEGRAALHAAIVEARAIEGSAKDGKTNSTPAAAAAAEGPSVPSSVVSETLFLAYTALERTYGSRDPSSLAALTLLSRRLTYSSLSERWGGADAATSAASSSSLDAPVLALALRLVGCGRDEARLEAAQKLIAAAFSNNTTANNRTVFPTKSSAAASSSFVAHVFAEDEAGTVATTGSVNNAATAAESDEGLALAAAMLKGGATDGEKGGAGVAEDGHGASGSNKDAAAQTELAIILGVIGRLNAALRAAKANGNAPLVLACDTARDAYASLVLGAVSLLVEGVSSSNGSGKPTTNPIAAGTAEAKELVRAALEALPGHSAELWVAAAKLEIRGAFLLPPSGGATSAAGPLTVACERVRKIYGAAIANLSAAHQQQQQSAAASASADPLTDESSSPALKRLHCIFDSYIGFERSIGATSSSDDFSSTATSSSSASETTTHIAAAERLLISMGGSGSAALSSHVHHAAAKESTDAVRSLFMEALKRFPCSVRWWGSFALYELSLGEADRCVALLSRGEAVLRGAQSRLADAVASAAASGATTTKGQRLAWEESAKEAQRRLDSLRTQRVGLLLQCGRGGAALDLFAEGVRAALAEYARAGVEAVEGGDLRSGVSNATASLLVRGGGGGRRGPHHSAGRSGGGRQPAANVQQQQQYGSDAEALAAMPSYRRLADLLAALPALAMQAYSSASNEQPRRGDDAASKAYAHVNGLYRALATELRQTVARLMKFTNVPQAASVCEPLLVAWRGFEGRYGTAATVAAVSCNPSAVPPPTTAAATAAVEQPAAVATAPVATAAAETEEAQPANVAIGKKRRRLADLADSY